MLVITLLRAFDGRRNDPIPFSSLTTSTIYTSGISCSQLRSVELSIILPPPTSITNANTKHMQPTCGENLKTLISCFKKGALLGEKIGSSGVSGKFHVPLSFNLGSSSTKTMLVIGYDSGSVELHTLQ